MTDGFFPIGKIYLSLDDISLALQNIDIARGSGPDEISPLILRNCFQSLIAPLYIIFNKSLTEGYFPVRWKTSYINLIFKSGSRNNVENYRGVAILPTIAKLFESMVSKELTTHFRQFFSTDQHGFVKGISTVTN